MRRRLAFWLFIAAALTDWLDGKIARERGEVSSFGRFMDAVIDKVMVIGLMIALVNERRISWGTTSRRWFSCCVFSVVSSRFPVCGWRRR